MKAQQIFDREARAERHLLKAQLRVVRNQRRTAAERLAAQRMRRFHQWAIVWRIAFWFGMAIALTVAATRCAAAELGTPTWHAIAHAWSHHNLAYSLATNEPFESRNWGVGARAEYNANFSAQAGAYRNSFNRRSYYLIADYTPIEVLHVRIGAFGGFVNHYLENGGRPLPTAGAIFRLQYQRASVAIRAIPPMAEKRVGVASIEFGWRL